MHRGDSPAKHIRTNFLIIFHYLHKIYPAQVSNAYVNLISKPYKEAQEDGDIPGFDGLDIGEQCLRFGNKV